MAQNIALDIEGLVTSLGGKITGRGRTPERNKEVGGVANSMHLDDMARDIRLPKGMTAREFRAKLQEQGVPLTEFVANYKDGHVHVGWRPKGQQTTSGGDNGGNTAFDRAQAKMQGVQGPSIAKIYDAYRAGLMSAEEAKTFERDVLEGRIMLPRGTSISAKPAPNYLPQAVANAYNNHSDMQNSERDQVDRDYAAGLFQLPPGVTLKRPAPRTAADYVGMGVRSVARGVGDVGNIGVEAAKITNPLIGVLDDFIDVTPDMADVADIGGDALRLPTPQTRGEKLVDMGIRGATGGLMTGGEAGLAGVAKNVITGATSGMASEATRQAGGGPVAQIAAAVAGGVGSYGTLSAGERAVASIAQRFGPKVARLTETVPPETIWDDAGNLTPDGQEYIQRAGASVDDVKEAYILREAANENAPAARAVDEPAPQSRPAVEEPVSPAATPEGVQSPETPTATAAAPENLTQTAKGRFDEAASEGVPLTRGQAEQSFSAQGDEQYLLRSRNETPEAEAARAFRDQKQTPAIAEAVERFKSSIAEPNLSPAQRGEQIKQAISDLRDQGKAGVSALYRQARELAESVGGQNSNLTALDTEPLLARMRELFIDESVPSDIRAALRQKAAQYGLIGQNAKTVEGVTTAQLLDDAGEVAERIKFTGPVRRLTIDTAEDLRQAINDLYVPTGSGGANKPQGLKAIIDDAVEAAVERAASSEGEGGVGQAYKTARQAYQTQQQTFGRGTLAEKIIGKRANGQDTTNPEKVIKDILAGGKEAETELKRIKAILQNGNEPARLAWKAVGAQAVDDIFSKAINPQTGEISGRKLNTEIAKFGVAKLKILLSPEEFNQLMKLQRIIKNATVPLDGTVNYSGSGYQVLDFFAKQAKNLSGAARYVPGAGPVIDGVINLAKDGAASARAGKTLQGITDYSPEVVATKAPAKDPVKILKTYLTLMGSQKVIGPLLVESAPKREPMQ